MTAVAMTSRRRFLQTANALAAWPAGLWAADGERVNDVHSQLNETLVDRVVRPSTHGDLRAVLQGARAAVKAVSVSGSRHAMGGQQFGSGTVLLDMRGMNRFL